MAKGFDPGELVEAVGEDESRVRRLASRRIGRAFRNIRSIRTLFATMAALNAVLLAAGLIVSDDVSVSWVGGAIALIVLLLAGWLNAHRHPLAWSIVIALIVTAIDLLPFFGILLPFRRAGWLVAAALWYVVVLAAQAQKLMRRYPDLYITQRWQGRRREPRESGTGRRVRTRRAEDRRRSRRIYLLAAGAGGLLLVAALVVSWLAGGGEEGGAEPPALPPFGNRARDFAAAWNRADLDAVLEFLPPRDRARRAPRVRRLMEERGWMPEPPALLAPGNEERGDRIVSTYRLAGHDEEVAFVVYWEAGPTNWWWVRTRWPDADLFR